MTYETYKNTIAAEKMAATRFMGIVDVDGTFVYEKPSSGELWQREIAARKKIRAFMDKAGVLASITMRTPGMMLTEASRRKAHKRGFAEPEPHLGKHNDGTRFYEVPETLDEFAHVLDWNVIGGVGSGILVQDQNGYAFDDKYKAYLGVSESWREATLKLLRLIDQNGDVMRYLGEIDQPGNYGSGKTDVAPLPYRIQLDFHGAHSLDAKQYVMSRIVNLRIKGNFDEKAAAHNVVFIDESKPESTRYTLYLIPRHGTKERMFDHIVRGLSAASGVPAKNMKLFFAGDTMTDLRAGLYGGLDAKVTFILVGGSRMTPYIVGDKRGELFAGESLAWLSNRLTQTEHRGVYNFNIPTKSPREVIFGDYAFPGTYGPETIAAWLDSQHF